MAQTINHVVVLMLENRSFDHVLGFTRSAAYPVDGLTGNESNPLDPHHPSSEIKVTPDAEDVLAQDPGHTFPDVNQQVFASPSGPPPSGAPNRGFIFSYAQQADVGPGDAPKIMRCFDPQRLPVITRLAREFAVCDQWFSSVPGPTWPNRFFAHCATSKGYLDNSAFHNYDMPTIFENLADNGRSWHIYFHDFAQALALRRLAEDDQVVNFLDYRTFRIHAKRGNLPDYAFIEPRYFNLIKRANDQHPPHDMQDGEALIAEVYDTIRGSTSWNETLLLIVYDEHGGTYDHVTPPAATPPDSHTGQFAFDRYGLRVPAVVVSPYVPKGTIEHDTIFDHASIPATLRKIFGLNSGLTARDENAWGSGRTFEKLASLDSPRQDTPPSVKLPVGLGAKSVTAARARRRSKVRTRGAPSPPISDLQRSLLDLANVILANKARRKTGGQLSRAGKATRKGGTQTLSGVQTEKAAALRVRQAMKVHLEDAKRRMVARPKQRARKK